MKKIWQVAWFEYQRNVFKKSFIFVLLSVPLILVLNIGVGFFMESMEDNDLPVGYIDRSGVFDHNIPSPADPEADDYVEFVRFESELNAQDALESKEIQAYYFLADGYMTTRSIKLVYANKPGENAERQFYDFLQINLLSAYPAEIAYRAASGTDVTVRSVDGKRNIPSGGPSFGLLMPLFISLAFLALLLMSSGYLMSAVSDEKENRTMEILVTSVSPMQIISGKVLGIVAIGLSLFATWIGVVITGIQIARRVGIEWFQNTDMDWSSIVSIGLVAVPAYILTAAVMTAIGAMTTSSQEGQSVSSIFIILHMIPLYVSLIFLNNPHQPAAVILSILPFTSLMTIGMRNLFSIVPSWQIAVSVGVQTVCAIGGLWIASRAFRFGMLRYGQRLSFRGLFNKSS